MSAFRDLSSDQQKRLEEAAGWRLKLTRDPALKNSPEYLHWCSDPRNAGDAAAAFPDFRAVSLGPAQGLS